MNFHISIPELDAYRNSDCSIIKRIHCHLHLLFCKKCKMELSSLKESDALIASIRKKIQNDEV